MPAVRFEEFGEMLCRSEEWHFQPAMMKESLERMNEMSREIRPPEVMAVVMVIDFIRN